MPNALKDKKIIVLGATGYVGGRLVSRLLDEGYHVRASGRSIDKLKSRFWARHPRVELVEVDAQDIPSLSQALKGCDTAFYFVHSMNPQSRDFESADRTAAHNMVFVSSQCGLNRIIYLGGLGEHGTKLSKHLKSRHEVSEILRSGKVPVTVFRAAMIIGSGSASFEILRYLVERLPLMITPRWVNTPNQPIAIRNVIEYLCQSVEKEETAGKTYDIGGKEVLSYLQLMRIYAQEAGLKERLIIPVPLLTPHLSSLWIHLVTPVPSYIARPLAEGLRNPVVCENDDITRIVPQEILDCRQAIRFALMKVHANEVQTSWVDAGEVSDYALVQEGDPKWAGGTMLEDRRQMVIRASREKIWSVVSRIGGERGWYHGTWLWVLRGFIDRLVGGVGLGRGRRDSEKIFAGDALDFWRVRSVQENEHLSLVAEMKLPGFATLDFKIIPVDGEGCKLIQHARFQPKGLGGILYWYMLIPLHEYIFGGMVRKIAFLSESTKDKGQGINMNVPIKVMVLVVIILLVLGAIQYIKVYNCFRIGNFDIKPWQNLKPEAGYKVLFAGDSTAVGTGLSDNAESTAGLFSKDFPGVYLENYSQNGLRLKGLIGILKTLQHKRFDLAVLQIGANDILFFTPMKEISEEHQRVLDLVKHISKRVIILHSGDIGESPLFIWPFSRVYTWRSLKVREIYSQPLDDRVSYIDIYSLNKSKDYSDCYARDHLHLNQKGYGIWYGFIKDQLVRLNWLPAIPHEKK